MDFESLAKRYADAGYVARTSATLVGGSGIRHSFSFAVSSKEGVPEVVADTALSQSTVDGIKVLGFFAKVYDVKPKLAVMCVSPRLEASPAELAKEYHIVVLQSEKPAELPGMLCEVVDKAIGFR